MMMTPALSMLLTLLLGLDAVGSQQNVPDAISNQTVTTEPDYLAPPDDLKMQVAEANLIVVAQFEGMGPGRVDSLGGAVGGPNELYVITEYRFVVKELLKGASRDHRGSYLPVYRLGGAATLRGGVATLTKAAKDSDRFIKGEDYLLFLSWWDAAGGYSLASLSGNFHLKGERAEPIAGPGPRWLAGIGSTLVNEVRAAALQQKR